MKNLNINPKWPRLFVKAIAVLSLCTAFKMNCSNGGVHYKDLMLSKPHFLRRMSNIKDISERDEKGNNYLDAAVKASTTADGAAKLRIIINRINEELKPLEDLIGVAKETESKKIYRYEAAKKEGAGVFPNAYHPKTNTTPFGQAVKCNYTNAVQMLSACKHIDINQATKTSKSFFIAVSRGYKHMADILLKLPNIEIWTRDPSGAYPLHWAIQREWSDVALSIMHKCPKNNLEGLRAKNKALETPLHLAIKYNLSNVVEYLVINLHAISDFYAKDKKEKTPLHIAARNNNYNVFKAVFQRIGSLTSREEGINNLFNKDTNGYTVFASTYLPKHIKQKWVHITEDNLKMFKQVLWSLKSNLDINQCKNIVAEINILENKDTIKKAYADKLREIANEILSAPAA